VVRDRGDEAASVRYAEAEDMIDSPPTRLDTLMNGLPHSFGRVAVLTVTLAAATAGLVIGTQLPQVTSRTEPGSGSTSAADTGRVAGPAAADDGLGRGLLTLEELSAIGEPASGGTYTRGSASSIPDPCSRPEPGDSGVSYVPGPRGATAVSFHVVGGTVTQRLTTMGDVAHAQARLRDVVSGVRGCQFEFGTDVALGDVGPGLGDEYVAGTVVRRYPSGASSTVALLLIRVGSSLVEFSITGPSATALDFDVRCRTISLAGMAR